MSFPAATDPAEIGHDHRLDGTESPSLTDVLPGDVVPGDAVPDGVVADQPGGQGQVELADQLIEFARAAATEEAGEPGQVGDYLGAAREDEVAVTAAFAATDRGYRGWHWSVTLAVVDPARPTVSEVVLLPGEQALLAPPWLPWEQRIRAGDVGAGDLLPTPPDDVRLVPGYVDSDDPDLQELEYEFGFGRERVLSREGRDEAAQRWHDGPFGPADVIAQQAPAQCVSCGFYVPLRGLLGMAMGACANEFSPADGRVVDAEYGCGAHSSTTIDAPLISAATETVVDELTLEVHIRPAPAPTSAVPESMAVLTPAVVEVDPTSVDTQEISAATEIADATEISDATETADAAGAVDSSETAGPSDPAVREDDLPSVDPDVLSHDPVLGPADAEPTLVDTESVVADAEPTLVDTDPTTVGAAPTSVDAEPTSVSAVELPGDTEATEGAGGGSTGAEEQHGSTP